MSKLLNFGLSLTVVLSFSLAHAVQNGSYKCEAETGSLNIPNYISAPATVNLDFTLADIISGGFQVTYNDFDFIEMLNEEVVKREMWIPGQFTFNEDHKKKNKANSYSIEEGQSYQTYQGVPSFKWSKNLNLYSDNGVVKLDIEFIAFRGENLARSEGFKLQYSCER